MEQGRASATDGWSVVEDTTGAGRIAVERQRQVEVEGYSAKHDDGVRDGLIAAGIAYAIASIGAGSESRAWDEWWPWSDDAWKPTGDRVRDLTKAGSLIAAAIDSELRARRPQEAGR